MKRTLGATVLSIVISASANATLLSRAGGQAYYDTTTNLTWIANANLAATNAFGVSGICANHTYPCSGPGTMVWSTAKALIAAMNTANYLGVNNWRLPKVTSTGSSLCAYTGTDCGYNVDLSTGEMARMFYSTLGNSAGYNSSGVQQPCDTAGPSFCLTNVGPFSNLLPYSYWYGTEWLNDTSLAWCFSFYDGVQSPCEKGNGPYAWAVSPGDTVVPLPAAAFLFPSALAAMGWARRRATPATSAPRKTGSGCLTRMGEPVMQR